MPIRSWIILLALLTPATAAWAQTAVELKAEPPELVERPEEEWINSEPLKLSELRGKVVVLHFWTHG
ncbi:MAG: hypothetical protein ACKV0T_19075 [Planctomycetales bacterium]